MHEIKPVLEIAERIEEAAYARGAKRVTLVRLRFNPLTSSLGRLELCFHIVQKNIPVLRDALLKLNQVDPLLFCKECRNEFTGAHLFDPCPQCHRIDVVPVHATDLLLEGFDCEE